MPVVVRPPVIFETPGSRPTKITGGLNDTVDLHFTILWTTEDMEARALVEANVPDSYAGLGFQTYELNPLESVGYSVVVHYASQEPRHTGDSVFTFDTGGGTQHLMQSLDTIDMLSPNVKAGQKIKTTPNFKGAIGVNGDSVTGVDITVPVFNFGTTKYIAPENITEDYVDKIFKLTGCTNNAEFKILVGGVTVKCATGECLFLGASGSQRGTEDWEINFKFSRSKNSTKDDNIYIGGKKEGIGPIEKTGWQYLWVRFEDSIDQKVLIKVPSGAYIEKVYEEGDFKDLKLDETI